jgi:hypothetical protein
MNEQLRRRQLKIRRWTPALWLGCAGISSACIKARSCEPLGKPHVALCLGVNVDNNREISPPPKTHETQWWLVLFWPVWELYWGVVLWGLY